MGKGESFCTLTETGAQLHLRVQLLQAAIQERFSTLVFWYRSQKNLDRKAARGHLQWLIIVWFLKNIRLLLGHLCSIKSWKPMEKVTIGPYQWKSCTRDIWVLKAFIIFLKGDCVGREAGWNLFFSIEKGLNYIKS